MKKKWFQTNHGHLFACVGKFLKIMKITIFIFAFAAMHAFASDGYAQTKRMDMKIVQSSIVSALEKIENQSEFFFFYNNKIVKLDKKVSVDLKDKTINEILDAVFADTGVEYTVSNRQIILSVKGDNSTNQQQKPVSGTVTDALGVPIPGVTIIEKGTTVGTVTDASGKFTIANVSLTATYVFSFIGMRTQEVTIGTKSTINLVMTEENINIDEVIAVGYGNQKKINLTGSIVSVKSKEVENLVVPNVSEALQSRVAGVAVSQSSGQPGRKAEILIRGFGNFSGIAPLWVIDGIAGDDPGPSFSLKDVESIDILKDAVSSAIYGARGAGGVILISTKKGKAGKLQVSFNTSHGMSVNYNMPTLMKKADYIKVQAAWNPGVAKFQNVDLSKYPETDWMDVMYRTGQQDNYNMSVSGGSEKSNYFISANYSNQTGAKVGNSFSNMGLRINTNHQIAKWWSIGQTLYLTHSDEDPVSFGDFPIHPSPGLAVYDDPTHVNPGKYGNWGWHNGDSPFGQLNPLAQEMSTIANNRIERLDGSVFTSITPVKNLVWKTTGGISLRKELNTRSEVPYYVSPSIKRDNSNYNEDWSESYDFTFNTILTYSYTLGKHSISPMIGFETLQGTNRKIGAFFNNFSDINVPTSVNEGVEDFTIDWTNRSSTTQYRHGSSSWGYNRRSLSYFGRISYNYAEKYLLDLSIRRDGSSNFGPEKRFGVFPSLSLAWRISEEPFIKNITAISSMKLKGGMGTVGNDAAEAYSYDTFYQLGGNYSFGDSKGAQGYQLQQKMPNPFIKWESIISTSVALETGFFDNRLETTIEYWKKDSKDLLYDLPIPSSAGMGSTMLANIGKVRNSGLELTVNYRQKVGEFTFGIGVNGSFLKNKVVNFDGISNAPIYDNGGQSGNTYYKSEVGQPIGQFYGLRAIGIWKAGDALDVKGPGGFLPRPGELKFEDVNHDGIISISNGPTGDKQYLGNPWPKLTYGISGNVTYKDFDMSFLFSGVSGNTVYSQFNEVKMIVQQGFDNDPAVLNNSYFLGNGATNQPAQWFQNADGTISNDPNQNYNVLSSYWLQDGSFLKLRNLQIGYTLPRSVIDKIGLGKARIYLMGQNLLTITKFKGIDPETTSSKDNIRTHGTADVGGYPPVRTYSMGIDLSF